MNLFQASTDLFRIPSLGHSGVVRLIELHGREHIDEALSMGRGAILVTAHLGPYELGGVLLAQLGYSAHAMVEEIDAETNDALAQYRGATGLKLFSRNGGTRQALRLLRDKQVVLLVADRVVGDGSDGLEVSFGQVGGRRRVPTGPAALALANGTPVVIGHIVRKPRGLAGPRYLMELGRPIIPGMKSHDAVRTLTQQIAQHLSDAVSKYAEQWYVFQPQWIGRDRTL